VKYMEVLRLRQVRTTKPAKAGSGTIVNACSVSVTS